MLGCQEQEWLLGRELYVGFPGVRSRLQEGE